MARPRKLTWRAEGAAQRGRGGRRPEVSTRGLRGCRGPGGSSALDPVPLSPAHRGPEPQPRQSPAGSVPGCWLRRRRSSSCEKPAQASAMALPPSADGVARPAGPAAAPTPPPSRRRRTPRTAPAGGAGGLASPWQRGGAGSMAP